jgi:hypothetical protein
MHVALKHYQHSFPQDQEERRITLILDFISPEDGDRGFDITTYTEALPRPPLEPVEVKIGRCPPSRHGKVAKDAQVYTRTTQSVIFLFWDFFCSFLVGFNIQWTRDRKVLEDQMGQANEVVMVDAESYLLEGTQSNVFVVMDGKVCVAIRNSLSSRYFLQTVKIFLKGPFATSFVASVPVKIFH